MTSGSRSSGDVDRELAVVEQDTQLKALSHPERREILRLLIGREATAAQLADWVGGTRGNVHYHVKELLKVGLVEVVRMAENGGALEKYYRAVARNFYVMGGVGEHDGLAGDVRQTVSASIMSWRRKEILEVDEGRIARKLVRDCLRTEEGDVVLIKGDLAQGEIIGPIDQAVAEAGASALIVRTGSAFQDLMSRWRDDLSSVVVLEEPLDYPGLDAAVDPQKDIRPKRIAFLRELARSGKRFRYMASPGYPLEDPAVRELVAGGKRLIYLGYPTEEKARVMGIDFRDLHDACWTALDVDYRELAATCERLRQGLAGATEVHVTAEGGTDLTFDVAGREVFVDDGVISDWEIANGRGWGHLPAGKLIVAPVAGTASGTLFSEMTDYLGVRIGGVSIEFAEGDIVHARAEENNDELLQLVLSDASGDINKLGGFEIGTNPRIRGPIGYAAWDAKSHGDVTFWIGDNTLIGGENEASLSWGFVVVRPTVVVDGEVLVEDRGFCL